MKSRFICQSHLQHIYSTCTVLFCKCAVAAHVLLCTVNVRLLHMYCCSTCAVLFMLQMWCCSTCAIMCCCRICSGIWRNGRKHQFYRHEVGVGVRFGVGIKEKIMLFSLTFYLFPCSLAGFKSKRRCLLDLLFSFNPTLSIIWDSKCGGFHEIWVHAKWHLISK